MGPKAGLHPDVGCTQGYRHRQQPQTGQLACVSGGRGPLCCSGSSISPQDPPALPVPYEQLFSFLLQSQGRLRLAYRIAPISTMWETPCPHPPPPSWQRSRVFWKVLARQQ